MSGTSTDRGSAGRTRRRKATGRRPSGATRSLTVAAMLAGIVALSAVACGEEGREVSELPPPVDRDLPAIQEGDTLVALMTYNSTGYFVYRGEAMGFEFRLLREFAEDQGMALRVEVVRDRDELFQRLNRGEGDVVAARLVPDPDYAESVRYTSALYRTPPAVVQRTGPPDSAAVIEPADTVLERIPGIGIGPDSAVPLPDTLTVSARLVRRPSELLGDTVHIPHHSEYVHRLVELTDTAGEGIEVVELEPGSTFERLIRMVARGQVRLGVSPENVAELKEEYFTNITVEPQVGPPVPVVWAVRENAPLLHGALESWLSEEEELVRETYETYFEDREGYREREESTYLTSETGRLSPFDELLKRHAPDLGWDWRLLAAQTFQESRFEPRARSWAGAMGLLQLMPGTARDMGVSDPYDPVQNVEGAVRYLQFLEEHWAEEIPDPDERLRFVLSSYNAGFGHVGDARRLTEKYGGDPDRWEDVSYWLLQKSKRRYYNDPVVRYGYARGIEPVTYVALILERYRHYLEFVTDEGPVPGADTIRASGAAPGR